MFPFSTNPAFEKPFPENCRELYRVLFEPSFSSEVCISVDCSSKVVSIDDASRNDELVRYLHVNILQQFRERMSLLPENIESYSDIHVRDGTCYSCRYCDKTGAIKAFNSCNPEEGTPQYQFVENVFEIAWLSFQDDPHLTTLEHLGNYLFRDVGGTPRHIRLLDGIAIRSNTFINFMASIPTEEPLLMDLRSCMALYSNYKAERWRSLFLDRAGKVIWIVSSHFLGMRQALLEKGIPENTIAETYEEALAKFNASPGLDGVLSEGGTSES